jgi:hypothetical protein
MTMGYAGPFVGCAIIYTVLLRPRPRRTSGIGGASGAMPLVLGWAAVTGDVPPEALLLFLIISCGRRHTLVAGALPGGGLRAPACPVLAGHARPPVYSS